MRALLSFLTVTDSPSSDLSSLTIPSVASSVSELLLDVPISKTSLSASSNTHKVARDKRLRYFMHVFLGCSLDPLEVPELQQENLLSFTALVSKLNGCVNQLEQFPVKVHDLPGSALTSTGRGGSTSAIKFFNTHQLKVSCFVHIVSFII